MTFNEICFIVGIAGWVAYFIHRGRIGKTSHRPGPGVWGGCPVRADPRTADASPASAPEPEARTEPGE